MDTQRLDKWLWYARFFKSRSLATKFCASGRLRVNEQAVKKAHHGLRVGDVLTVPKARHIRVVRVVDLGARRGPATEAQALYDDLQPPSLSGPGKKDPGENFPRPVAAAKREPGAGRPTKRERRETDKLKRRGRPPDFPEA